MLQFVWVALVLVLWRLAETSLEAVWAFPGMTHLWLTVLICKPMHLWKRFCVKRSLQVGGLLEIPSNQWYLAAAMVAITSASISMGACSFVEPPMYHYGIQLAIVLIIIMTPLRNEVQTLLEQRGGEPTVARNSHDGVSQEHLLSRGRPMLSMQTPVV